MKIINKKINHLYEDNSFDLDDSLNFLDELDDIYDSNQIDGSPIENDWDFEPDDSIFSLINDEDIEQSTPNPPTPGNDTGISAQLSNLIKDEWEAIDGYNSTIATLSDINDQRYLPILQILKDIVNEENIHVGQLEAALKLVSPNATSITTGQVEAKEQISDVAHPFMQVQSHQPSNITSSVNLDDDPYTTQCTIADIDDTF